MTYSSYRIMKRADTFWVEMQVPIWFGLAMKWIKVSGTLIDLDDAFTVMDRIRMENMAYVEFKNSPAVEVWRSTDE